MATHASNKQNTKCVQCCVYVHAQEVCEERNVAIEFQTGAQVRGSLLEAATAAAE